MTGNNFCLRPITTACRFIKAQRRRRFMALFCVVRNVVRAGPRVASNIVKKKIFSTIGDYFECARAAYIAGGGDDDDDGGAASTASAKRSCGALTTSYSKRARKQPRGHLARINSANSRVLFPPYRLSIVAHLSLSQIRYGILCRYDIVKRRGIFRIW